MIYECNDNVLIFHKKILIIFEILGICGFSINWISGGEAATPIIVLAASAIAGLYCLRVEYIYLFIKIDFILFIFITYLLSVSVIKDSFDNTILVLTGSIFIYYIGRVVYLSNEISKILVRTLTVVGWILNFMLLKTFLENGMNVWLMKHVAGINHIGISEILGIVAIANIFGYKTYRIKIIPIATYIASILTMLIILNSRGAVIAVFIVTFVIKFILTKSKPKYILILILIIAGYSSLFRADSFLVKSFPSVARFSIDAIMKDPSVVGSDTYDLGRLQLYEECLDKFYDNLVLGAGALETHPHNIFLEAFGSYGIIGGIIFVAFLYKVLKYSISIINKNTLIVALFYYSLFYRQTSFAFDTHKSLFLFAGLLVNFYLCDKLQQEKYHKCDGEGEICLKSL